MEYKIGQIFEIDDVWYQFVEYDRDICKSCVFYQSTIKCSNPDEGVKCSKWHRKDGRGGHFVRLLPIGDVYEQGGATWQQYKCVDKPNTEDKRVYISYTDSDIGLIISVRLTENDDLNLIERKIGEIFEHNGEWYQCIENIDCENCAFNAIVCDEIDDIVGPCSSDLRRDGKSVVFKKLEKVGEAFACRNMSFGCYGIIVQRYKVFAEPILTDNSIRWCDSTNKTILIALNNKEDMEECNNTKHSNSENIGKNLKPFDLEAAKSGKPVCTRDGRKARIICFDKITRKNYEEFKIIALVRNKDNEDIHVYNNKGRKYLDDSSEDLMMLPEKKEGWVNVSKFSTYASKEEALSHKTYDIIDTIKVFWEE